MNSPILMTEKLTKTFGGIRALNDLSLTVRPGGIHAIIGPNGAGKSTLFNVILGEAKPSSGRVHFKAKDITGLPTYRIARLGITRKFQLTTVFNNMTVYENIAVAAQSCPLQLFTEKQVKARVEWVLDLMGLKGKRDHLAGILSHGERQRVELGMALATDAQLILLDEPTSGMSVEEKEGIGPIIREIAGTATILIIEHDFQFVKQLATRVTVLDKGRKLAEGDVGEIECDPQVRQCYLGGWS